MDFTVKPQFFIPTSAPTQQIQQQAALEITDVNKTITVENIDTTDEINIEGTDEIGTNKRKRSNIDEVKIAAKKTKQSNAVDDSINTDNLKDLNMKSLLKKQALNLDTIEVTDVQKPITVENIEGTTEFKTRMNLGYMIIYTADVVSSVEFYEKAFNLNRGFVHDSKQYAEMETGQTKLAFVSDELISKSLPISYHKNIKSEVPAGIEVVFVTKDIEKAYTNAVKNGATPVKEPVEKPWGQMVGYVRDNNGVVIELASPLDERLDFGYVIVYTANVADSVQFYEKAFNMKPGFLHESGQYAEMDTGHTKLAFVSDELISQGLPIPYRKNIQSEVPAGVEVVLVAKDIENAYTHAIKNGATPVKKPEEKPWGQMVGYVRDNNGVVIELTTPIG